MFTKWQFNYDIVHYEYFMEGSNDITLESWGIIYIYIYNRSFWSFHIFPRQHLFILFFKFWFFFPQSFMRLTLSNLYAFLKPKTLTFDPSLFALFWVLPFPLSLFIPQTSPFQAILIHSFALALLTLRRFQRIFR